MKKLHLAAGLDSVTARCIADVSAMQEQIDAAVGRGGIPADVMRLVDQRAAMEREAKLCNFVDASSFMPPTALAIAVAQLHAGDTVGNATKQFYDEQKLREQAELEQSVEDSRRPQILDMPYYNPMDAIQRRREADRDDAIETARLAEIARLEVQDAHAAAQRAAGTT